MDKKEQAQKAMDILNNPIFNAVYKEIDTEIVRGWRIAQTQQAREEFFLQQRALCIVVSSLMRKVEAIAKGGESSLRDIAVNFINKNKG